LSLRLKLAKSQQNGRYRQFTDYWFNRRPRVLWLLHFIDEFSGRIWGVVSLWQWPWSLHT